MKREDEVQERAFVQDLVQALRPDPPTLGRYAPSYARLQYCYLYGRSISIITAFFRPLLAQLVGVVDTVAPDVRA